jgi:hypothetical protein
MGRLGIERYLPIYPIKWLDNRIKEGADDTSVTPANQI